MSDTVPEKIQPALNVVRTKAEANRQIRLLTMHSTPTEREQLEKYIMPISEAAPAENARHGQPVHISEVLPVVMMDIEQRCKKK